LDWNIGATNESALDQIKNNPQATLSFIKSKLQDQYEDFDKAYKEGKKSALAKDMSNSDFQAYYKSISHDRNKVKKLIDDFSRIEIIPGTGMHGYKGKSDPCKHDDNGELISRPHE
jgi:hypothetical protein